MSLYSNKDTSWPGNPPQQLLTSPPFCLGTNVVGTKVYGAAFSGVLSSGGLLRSDWLPPNCVIAHYHKVDLISTLLDALIVQNAPRRSRRRLSLKMNDFRPLWRSRRVRCECTVMKMKRSSMPLGAVKIKVQLPTHWPNRITYRLMLIIKIMADIGWLIGQNVVWPLAQIKHSFLHSWP